MTESVRDVDADPARTRRSLLAGALGGLGAWFLGAAARVAPAEAAAGSYMVIGSEVNDAGSANTQLLTNSNVVAFKLLQNGPGTALMGYATPASGATRGVYGRADSPNGFGIQARNAGAEGTGAAIQAFGVANTGIEATCDNGNRYAVHANHEGSGGSAVFGESATGTGIYGTGGSRGVWGDSSAGNAVHGNSDTGNGVYGFSTSGYAGRFDGRVRISQYLDFPETFTPLNPPANTARLFIRDNGGKTQLCVIFPSGAEQIIKTEA